MDEQVKEIVENEVPTKSEEELSPESPKGVIIPLKDIKTSSYYVVILGKKILSKDDYPVLYHKNLWYKNPKTDIYERAYEVTASEVEGTFARADKKLSKINPPVYYGIVLGKVDRKVF